MPKAISKEPKNVTTACDPCRSSKMKCDGEDLCFQCRSRNITCLYTKVDGRTRAAAKKAKDCFVRKIEKLKATVKRLRLRLAGLPGGTNSAGASVNDSASDVDSTSKVDIGPSPVADQAAHLTLYGTGLHSPRTRPSSPNWTRDTHARSLSDSHAVRSDGLHLTIPPHHAWRQPTSPLTPESGPSPVSSHASLGDSSPSSENHATAQWIQTQSMGTARQGSAQDDVALALSLGALDVRARTPSAQSGSPYSAHSPRSPVPYTPRATDKSPYLPFALHALSEQDHDTILTTYLHTVGQWRSHVVPELFFEDLRAVRAGNTATTLFFSPALHCACLLNALVSSDPNNPGWSPSTLNELFRTAKELAQIECAADEQIAPAVIAVVILAGYSMQFSNGSRLAYLLLGYASRAADTLHLNIPVASDPRATWGRAWSYWELFRMDTVVALHVQSASRLARPCTAFHVVQQGIQREIAKLQLPSAVDSVQHLVHDEICHVVSAAADPPPSFDGFAPPSAPLYTLRDVLNLRRASFPLELQLASYNEVSPPPAVLYVHGLLDCVILLSHRGPDTTRYDEVRRPHFSNVG
ncbi:hypothetical protein EXIGLDRAFT_490270 [Exidia glandulosa HHB12029]|uniref:Zn(2)-C6 fungal-type domain-containing protein n=1 Tax=Exidia glandulosa HHB12029 TaxID=1314781 RepID=A0A165JMX5_EXIGL|nr:hypothetical protein EXIGLDRAFT_490270 [Exidia glandulosa HHB12029]